MLELPKCPPINPAPGPRAIASLNAGDREYIRRRLEAEFVYKIASELECSVESVRAAIADGLRRENHLTLPSAADDAYTTSQIVPRRSRGAASGHGAHIG